MAVPAVVQSVVTFLRTGYPEGVPEQDYQPLLALLRRRLTLDEVRGVAGVLAEAGDVATADAICRAIEDVTHAEASDPDVERVRAHLRGTGLPVAEVSDGDGDGDDGGAPVQPSAH